MARIQDKVPLAVLCLFPALDVRRGLPGIQGESQSNAGAGHMRTYRCQMFSVAYLRYFESLLELSHMLLLLS
jgi:hypothetical protein